MKIGFITSLIDPQLIKDDRLVFPHLEKHGHTCEPVIWDNHPDLSSFDVLIFRSCWNYHEKTEEFYKWLESLRSVKTKILNPLDVCIWNVNKSYLLELKDKGVVMPETVLVKKGEKVTKKFDSKKYVVKPAISLNGYDTFLVDELTGIEANVDLLIQEYLPEIKTTGEISLIFFNKEFSHALQKLPTGEEFRIHVEYGGTRQDFSPSKALIDEATSIVNKISEPLLYCRVDVVLRNDRPYLIELEIIDPMLFLGYAEGAPERFAEAIMTSIK